MEHIDQSELDRMTRKAQKIVAALSATAGAIGLAPVPGSDAPLLVAQQTAMLAAISGAFSLDVNGDALRNLVIAAVTMGGTSYVGKTIVANILKLVPGGGSVAGGVISATTASVVALLIGEAYIQLCRMILRGELDTEDLAAKKGADAFITELKKISKQKKATSHRKNRNHKKF